MSEKKRKLLLTQLLIQYSHRCTHIILTRLILTQLLLTQYSDTQLLLTQSCTISVLSYKHLSGTLTLCQWISYTGTCSYHSPAHSWTKIWWKPSSHVYFRSNHFTCFIVCHITVNLEMFMRVSMSFLSMHVIWTLVKCNQTAILLTNCVFYYCRNQNSQFFFLTCENRGIKIPCEPFYIYSIT